MERSEIRGGPRGGVTESRIALRSIRATLAGCAVLPLSYQTVSTGAAVTRETDVDILMGYVPAEGAIGNVTLLAKLKERGWSEEKYWRVRENLLKDSVLERGKGKGGSVRRCLSDDHNVPQNNKALRTYPEGHLYEPLLKILRADWAREMRIEPDQIHFEITARLGKKATGGTWTRPDITAVSVRRFPHLPNSYLDIWTFEVKPVEWLDVTAIFEAAAHASRATRSYALLQIPESVSVPVQELLDRCEREAVRLRVGLITFASASNFETWETRAEAPRLDTAPEALEEFIGHLSNDARSRLAKWK
jgi:hypothetical protein